VTKPALTAAIAMMMAIGAPVAMAQSVPQPTRPMASTPAALTLQADQMRASKLIGSSVYDVQNEDIGSVKDVILDRDGRVAAVVLDVGSFLGMGGKFVGVRLGDIKTDNNRLTLDMSKAQLQAAQAYQLDTDNGSNQAGH
jgi:sporulation protein YlmC with PRC-barrel domain